MRVAWCPVVTRGGTMRRSWVWAVVAGLALTAGAARAQPVFDLNRNSGEHASIPSLDTRSLKNFGIGEVGIFSADRLCSSRERIGVQSDAKPVSPFVINFYSTSMLLEVTRISARGLSVRLIEPFDLNALGSATEKLIEKLLKKNFIRMLDLPPCLDPVAECATLLCRPLFDPSRSQDFLVLKIDGFESINALISDLRSRGWYNGDK